MQTLTDTTFCIDSLPIFRQIDQLDEIKSAEVTKDLVDELIKCEKINWQQINERTPSNRKLTQANKKTEENGGPPLHRKVRNNNLKLILKVNYYYAFINLCFSDLYPRNYFPQKGPKVPRQRKNLH